MPLRCALLLLSAIALCACERASRAPAQAQATAADAAIADGGRVTVGEDEDAGVVLNWQAPSLLLAEADIPDARRRATRALAQEHLYATADDAIPLYLAILAAKPDDAAASSGLQKACAALLRQGDASLRTADSEADVLGESLREARQVAAVARSVWPDDESVLAYLQQVDTAEQIVALDERGERQLQQGELGESVDGALGSFRAALQLGPENARARQGLAAVESALIRRAEDAAQTGDFDAAARWLLQAGKVRDGAQTIADARQRIEAVRAARIAALRDAGVNALSTAQGLTPPAMRRVREQLAEVLRIAAPGDPVAADFRRRVDLAAHYGLFRPGQAFTDALSSGGRGPEMIVVPHGAFRMGAEADEADAADAEKPAHYIRFDRGFALSRRAVTVAEFRRFVESSGHRPRATRRGHSLVYDALSGNFVLRSGVDWRSGYDGRPAADDMPVLHVSVHDAEAYAQWLSQRTGAPYRLPSEAEFEYTMRAGTRGRYPWGDAATPPKGFGNLAGGLDVSPSGRRWNNAFPGYADGWWGPAPGGTFKPNAWGLYDMGGNLSEWVADCWHASYRRAPADGAAWFNPGCRARVVRGGSWASSPAQSRAAWRSSTDSDMTNARLGFRVMRGI